jgi:hypothetical protein
MGLFIKFPDLGLGAGVKKKPPLVNCNPGEFQVYQVSLEETWQKRPQKK